MILKQHLLLCLFLTFATIAKAQDGFVLQGTNQDKIDFEFVRNLTIVPLTINGKELSFLLDTGVKNTMIFSLKANDSLELNSAEKIKLIGLDGKTVVDAVKSTGNTVKLGKAINTNHNIYVVFDQELNFSTQLGVQVHGIIGYEFFKDFVVECNYISKVIKVYEPSAYNVRKKCRGCTALSVEFENNKPYINAEVQVGGNVVTTKLLVDSGSSDGLWLFHNSSEDLNKPTKSFRDYLGLGLTGDIFGDRSKVKHLKLDKFKLKNVTAAYPDTLALSAQAITNDRNGSLGSEVLRRFKVVIDYPRERILLKKNKDFYDDFTYDMSGLVIAHDGFSVYEDKVVLRPKDESDNKKEINLLNNSQARYNNFSKKKDSKINLKTHYELKPKFVIKSIRPDSPAENADLKVGDIVETINGKPAFKYTLNELNEMFSSQENKKIKFTISRFNLKFSRTMVLKGRL